MATFKNIVTGNTVTATNPTAVSLMEKSENYIREDKKTDKTTGKKNEGEAK